MVGNFGTVLARNKTLFIFWGMTLALIVAALGIQGWEAGLKNQGKAVTYAANSCPVPVSLTYPSFLFLPSSNTPEQSIVISVAEAAKSYDLVMKRQEWFTFYENDGAIKAHVSYWADAANEHFAAVLSIPTINGNQELELHFQGNDAHSAFSCKIGLQDEIEVETAAQAGRRSWLGIFARNIALPLGLLSAIAGWAVSYLAKETDKLEIAFREKMGKLAIEFRSDPLYVVEQCLELKRTVTKKSLGGGAEKELDHAVRGLFNQDGVGKLLKQIGECANRQDNIALTLALALVTSFHEKFAPVLNKEAEVDIVFRAIQHVYHYFSKQRNFVLLYDLELPMKTTIGKWELPSFLQEMVEWAGEWQANRRIKKAESIIMQLLRIWDEQDVYSSDFVIYGLNKFRDIRPVVDYAKENIETSPSRRRLKRYKQLDWLGGELVPYDWPPLIFRDEPFRYPLLHNWFKKAGILSANPFEPQPRSDPQLLDSAITMQTHLQSTWERLVSAAPVIFTARFPGDLVSVALLAQNAFQNPAKYRMKDVPFPIFFEIPASLESNDWLLALAHRAAEVWLDLLAYSPDACLDMYPEERLALASWLGWHCGSTVIAVERLRQRLFRAMAEIVDQGKDERKAQKKEGVGQLLLDFLAGGKSTYSKENSPSFEQLLQWLSIRPFRIEKTIAILVAEQILPASLSQALADSSPILAAHGIVLKQFRLEGDVQPERASAITWPKEALKEILVNRIKLTSGGRESFADLFESPPGLRDFVPPDYDDQLAEKAQGSLNRLLELGLKILLHHATYRADIPDLLDEDFRVIENL